MDERIKNEDLQILEQLYLGNHLEPKELSRAKRIVHGLNVVLMNRMR